MRMCRRAPQASAERRMKPAKERWKKKRRPAAHGPVGTTIPVVDDFGVLTRMFLCQVGFKVKDAATGIKTRPLTAERSDVVILDVNLPDIMGGLEDGVAAYPTLPIESKELIANVKSLPRIDRAEMEPRESREGYRQTIDMALEGVWTIDAGAITTYVNGQMAAMLGHSAAGMIGKSLYDFMERDLARVGRAKFRTHQAGPQAAVRLSIPTCRRHGSLGDRLDPSDLRRGRAVRRRCPFDH